MPADTEISGLDAASTLDGSEVIAVVQGGVTKKTTLTDAVGVGGGGGGIPIPADNSGSDVNITATLGVSITSGPADIQIQSGGDIFNVAGNATSGYGGEISLTAGSTTDSGGYGGSISLLTGESPTYPHGGQISLYSNGLINIFSEAANTTTSSESVQIYPSTFFRVDVNAGPLQLYAQGADGEIDIAAGGATNGAPATLSAGSGSTNGGHLNINAGKGTSGTNGKIKLGVLSSTLAQANNGQTVTYGNVGPGSAAISIKRWIRLTVDGVDGWVPHFGV